jgi:hypothetical protein
MQTAMPVDLISSYVSYCSLLDVCCTQFVQLCKDAHLMNTRVRKADIDLVYARWQSGESDQE